MINFILSFIIILYNNVMHFYCKCKLNKYDDGVVLWLIIWNFNLYLNNNQTNKLKRIIILVRKILQKKKRKRRNSYNNKKKIC
jgi:hypothetical protein